MSLTSTDMPRLSLLVAALLCLHRCPPAACLAQDFLADAYSAGEPQQRQQQRERAGLDYALKRAAGALLLPELGLLPVDSRERRAAGAGGVGVGGGGASGMGSSFIRFGRGGGFAGGQDLGNPVSQPHTRSDIIIRYGRDGLNGRLNRLRQERMRRLARLAFVCAAKSQEEAPASSAEDKILREICKDAPLHPTVPDFV